MNDALNKPRSRGQNDMNKRIKRAEKHAYNIAKSMLHRKSYSRLLRVMGPGIVTGAADDDPSGIATYSQTGAAYGFGLLWIFPFMFPLLLAVQESCSRIGAVTGKGLAAILKENYSKKLLYMSVILVVVANTINIGADLGAMAATTQLFVDLPFGLLAALYAVIIMGLVIFVNYKSYAKILKWLAVALLAYPVTAFLIGQNWPEIFAHTFTTMPQLDLTTMYILVGILGTTISPYLFFWDTSEVVEEEIAKRRLTEKTKIPRISKRFLRGVRLDNFVGMSFATITAWFIVIVCASVLFKNGITEINTASDAAMALEPLVQGFPNAGLIAKLIFSVGIIGIGLLAVPVLAGSSAYAISETVGWKEGLSRKFKKAIGFYCVIIAATLVGLLINFLGIDPIQALIFTAVFNGVAAVPLLFMIARIGNSSKILGEYKNGPVSNFFVRMAFVVMAAAVIVLLYSFIVGIV
ncbi:MAG: Natural resistance-associated macrophage protein [Candidatus Saccharibacteria bacterium]|nr:Natural resistance-associated macrophage protein [Candidatus Saccharibacteria bacterium]